MIVGRGKIVTMSLHVISIIALCILLQGSGSSAAPIYDVTMSMKAFGNSFEGIDRPSCDASNEVQTGKQTKWWITIGGVRPNPQGGWELIDNAVRCGGGSFEKSNALSGRSSHAPYLIAAISTMAAVSGNRLGPEKLLRLDISLSLRKLSGFSTAGEPRFEQLPVKRTFFFVEHGTVFLPLLMADEKEKEAFKLHEALIGIGAKLTEKKGIAAYGAVSVSSDLDDAELFLDGGEVGKVSIGKATSLTNVLAGDHEVSVRDSSGHEIHRIVHVEQNRTAMVSVKLADQECNAVPYRLVFLGKNSQGFDEYRREMDEAVVVRIPAGEFLMGNLETERQPLEHRVDLSEFLMDKNPVTWGQYKRFAGVTGASLPPDPPYWGTHDDQPAVFVTWEEAKVYCEWAGGRLPTEAEWEKAARGTDNRKYPWGNEEPTPQRGVYRRNWGYTATDPIRAHPSGASPYGLLDMGGNVWEWVADWYDDKYYEASPKRNPKGPRTGQAHVVRGGSWDSRPSVLSASCRNFGYRGYREGDFGFRCAMDPMD
jgi:formylglycine-generating enzyme required for sulfatase activity